MRLSRPMILCIVFEYETWYRVDGVYPHNWRGARQVSVITSHQNLSPPAAWIVPTHCLQCNYLSSWIQTTMEGTPFKYAPYSFILHCHGHVEGVAHPPATPWRGWTWPSLTTKVNYLFCQAIIHLSALHALSRMIIHLLSERIQRFAFSLAPSLPPKLFGSTRQSLLYLPRSMTSLSVQPPSTKHLKTP